MTETITQGQVVTPEDTPPVVADQQSAATENTEHMIPKSRFDEINNKAKDAVTRAEKLEQELADFRTQQTKDAEEKLKKQGEFEELYNQAQAKTGELETQLQTASDQLAKLEGHFKAALEKRVEALPDHIKPLIAHLNPFDAMAYLDEHEQSLVQGETGPRKQNPPQFNAGDGTRGKVVRDVTLTKQIRF